MLNCYKKFFVILLSFFLIPSIYAAEYPSVDLKGSIQRYRPRDRERQRDRETKLNNELWKAIKAVTSKQDFTQIEKCLNEGANPNAISEEATPLEWAICKNNTNLMEFFIKRGADINLRNGKFTPLEFSIFAQEYSPIEILCDSGASLVNCQYPGTNAFHCAVKMGEERVIEIIKILITHARFNSYDQNQKLKERKVLAALSVLSELCIDIRFRILEQLALTDDDDYFSCKKLNQKLLKLGYSRPILAYSRPILAQVHERVQKLKEILGSVDSKHKETPLDWALQERYSYENEEANKEMRLLLDGNELQKNWDNFNAGFPDILKSDPGNPVCEMYNKIVLDLKNKSFM